MIKNIKEIVIASHNEGKVREIRSLLKPMGFKIYSAKKFCINEPIENGKTFKENSLIKSKNAAKKSGIPAIADDSGLCILSLGNQPDGQESIKISIRQLEKYKKKFIKIIMLIRALEKLFFVVLYPFIFQIIITEYSKEKNMDMFNFLL